MNRWSLCPAVALIALALGGPMRANGQAPRPAWLAALALPPGDRGVCGRTFMDDAAAGTFPRGTPTITVDMVEGWNSRELHLTTDTASGLVRYMEVLSYTDTAGESVVENIGAFFSEGGAVSGTRVRVTPPVEAGKLKKATVPLDSLEQRRVKELVASVKRRCPP